MIDSRDIPQNAARQCASCRNHIPYTMACKAFPKGIPTELMSGSWDHREPYEGDNGVLYEPENPQKPVTPPHPKNKRQ